jgi:prolyl oligopeptidase
MRSGKATPFIMPRLAFNPADYVVEQRTYPSKDGTMVPMHRAQQGAGAGQQGRAHAALRLWRLRHLADAGLFGGAHGVAAIGRGVRAGQHSRGREFGKAWHDAGRLDRKQNSFDDFIAAGEYRSAGHPRDGLAVQGGSNGGLLVGAVVNQRPDLFAAANPDVGVMDMLRFDRFTSGRFWVDDYGSPEKEADWRVLRLFALSQRAVRLIRRCWSPPRTDDRVVPAHSFKYVAALQAAIPATSRICCGWKQGRPRIGQAGGEGHRVGRGCCSWPTGPD